MSKTTIDDKGRARRPSTEAPNRERDRYTSGTEIARGGMGRVVEATDTLLGRAVALKEALSTDPEALRRFARETKITARLEHPSIVPVYDAGTSSDGSPYYVMRKVSGRPLEQLVAAAQTLTERLRLLPHVVAAAQALAHAHQRKVVHRDLKPSNILVGDLGETVVIDWGLAKVLGEEDADGDAPTTERLDAGASMKTRIGTVFGTPGFMAPEQLRGEAVDARVDVYALGATLYFMLARQPPHAAPSGDEMMSAAAAGPPKPLGQVAPGVPRELTTIVDKALSYREAARYPDAATFAEDLSRFLTGQLVASHRYSRRERLVRFMRRNRVPVAVVALAVIALAVGGTVGMLRVLAERDRADAQAALATQGQRDAQDRADQLLLSQAETLVASNPTGAVALLKQLTADPVRRAALWRQVRAIAASARIAGVARGLPATRHPKSIEMSPGGTQAVIAGRDGSVWVYDLAAHRHRQVGQFVPDRVATFVGEKALAIYRERDFSFLDLETGARRDLVMPLDVWTVQVGTHRIFAIGNEARELYELPLDATRGNELRRVMPGPTADVQLSADGRWIAVADDKRLAIADATQPTLAFRELGPGGATNVAWSPDTRALIATYPKRLAWIDVASGTTRSYAHEDLAFAPLALANNVMFLSSTGGIRWLQAHTVSTRYVGELNTGIGIHAAPED
ncbi:MAG TPA: protein kinase, partial [Kofleriaceae bacterium]